MRRRRPRTKSDTFSPASISRSAHTVGKTLVVLGLVAAAVGALIMLGAPVGRLPGDFMVRRGNVSFYFPLATSIVVSILLTLLFALFRR